MIRGGLVPGVIINLTEYILNGVVLAKDMEAAISALGRQMGGGGLVMFAVWGFLVGISQSGYTASALRRPFRRYSLGTPAPSPPTRLSVTVTAHYFPTQI